MYKYNNVYYEIMNWKYLHQIPEWDGLSEWSDLNKEVF